MTGRVWWWWHGTAYPGQAIADSLGMVHVRLDSGTVVVAWPSNVWKIP